MGEALTQGVLNTSAPAYTGPVMVRTPVLGNYNRGLLNADMLSVVVVTVPASSVALHLRHSCSSRNPEISRSTFTRNRVTRSTFTTMPLELTQ